MSTSGLWRVAYIAFALPVISCTTDRCGPSCMIGEYRLRDRVVVGGSIQRTYEAAHIELRRDFTYTWIFTGRTCNFREPCAPLVTVTNTGRWTISSDSVHLGIGTASLPALHGTSFHATPQQLTGNGAYGVPLVYVRQ